MLVWNNLRKLNIFYSVFSGLLTWTTIVYFDRQITNLDELFDDEESTDELVFTEYYEPEIGYPTFEDYFSNLNYSIYTYENHFIQYKVCVKFEGVFSEFLKLW